MDPARINESDVSRVETLFDVISDAIPHVVANIFTTSPFDAGPAATTHIVTAPTLSGAANDNEEEDSFGNTFGIQDSSTLLDEKQKKKLLHDFDEYLAARVDVRLTSRFTPFIDNIL